MALEPGNLSDLSGAGQAAWDSYVATQLAQAKGSNPLFVLDGDPDLGDDLLDIDWRGKPLRLPSCLASERKAAQLLDWRDVAGDRGRVLGQEEYLEWRLVRTAEGKIRKVELTSETPEYWSELAAHHPMTALRLLGRFAGEDVADPREVFGPAINPFTATAQERKDAFRAMMSFQSGPSGSDLPPRSPYNNGRKAITYMCQRNNTLGAAIALAGAAAQAFAKDTPAGRVPLTGRELINFTLQAAADCRDSDPTIVETVARLAFEGRKIALAEPLGLYIGSVSHEGLLLPDEQGAVPAEWFELQRGSRQGVERSQRLVLEVPPGLGFVVGDLIEAATGNRVERGAQLAQLVQLRLYAKASAPGTVQVEARAVRVDPLPDCGIAADCGLFRAAFDEMAATEPASAPVPVERPATRNG